MGIKANKIHSLSLELPFSNRLLFYWSTEQVLIFFDMTNDLPPSTAIANVVRGFSRVFNFL